LPDESRTSVYKLYRATRNGPDTSIDPRTQIAFYLHGIGVQFAWNEARQVRLPRRSHLPPQEKDLRRFKLFGTGFRRPFPRRSTARAGALG
jgi:hypothetical protein